MNGTFLFFEYWSSSLAFKAVSFVNVLPTVIVRLEFFICCRLVISFSTRLKFPLTPRILSWFSPIPSKLIPTSIFVPMSNAVCVASTTLLGNNPLVLICRVAFGSISCSVNRISFRSDKLGSPAPLFIM